MERQGDIPADALPTPGLKQALENTPCGGRRWIDCTGRMGMRPSDGNSWVNKARDFIYIKPGVAHEVFNMSDPKPSSPLWPAHLPTSGTALFLTTAASRI